MIPLRDDNPTRSFPVVTVTFIVINCLMFLVELGQGRNAQQFIETYGMKPAEILHDRSLEEYMTFLTSMFLHGGWMHLIGNMLYLWIFGNNIEDAMGKFRFVIFYLLAGFGASAAHIFSDAHSMIPTIGASGAISGVLGAYLLLFPHARVMTLLPLGMHTQVIYLPSWVLLVIWFGMQLFSGWYTAGGEGGGVAFWAHVGGFVAGIILVPLFKRRDVRFFAPAHHAALERETL